jgi:hypothetical protein
MSNNQKISTTDLDFDNIKANLINYLQGQSKFQDYNFEGSALSVLLDVLAYNTHYNALYNNLAVNEMFLDSARKRNSVVSLAKMLGYRPRSSTSSTAQITLTITVPTGTAVPMVLTLPQYSSFISNVNGTSYTFFNRESITVSATGNTFVFPNITITEGTPLTNTYTYNTGDIITIPNQYADLNTLNITVQDNANSSIYNYFKPADSLVNVGPTSTVYWVKEMDDGLYEIDFGDGNLGVALLPGNIVYVNYFVSSLDAPNGANIFTYNGGTLISGASVSVTTLSSAIGGSDVESIDSIRFNAPKFYSSQNRAVTVDDYKSIVYANVPEAQSVSVWGGEDNIPTVYGQVYVCIKPYNVPSLTALQKADIINNVIKPRGIVSVITNIVDPDAINIQLTITAYYNNQITNKSPSDLATIIRNVVNDYNNSDLQNFDGVFRFSKLSKLIDAADPAIENNITTLFLQRAIANPQYNTSAEYIINLINPIRETGTPDNAILSSGFYIPGSTNVYYLDDDGVGNIRLFYYGADGSKVIANATIGSVNYSTGYIDVKNLTISTLYDQSLYFTIKPLSNDVVSALSQYAQIDMSNLTINVLADPTASGLLGGGNNYTFTPSAVA